MWTEKKTIIIIVVNCINTAIMKSSKEMIVRNVRKKILVDAVSDL